MTVGGNRGYDVSMTYQVPTDYVQTGATIILTHGEGPVLVTGIVWEAGNYFEPTTEITVAAPSGTRTVVVPMGSEITVVS